MLRGRTLVGFAVAAVALALPGSAHAALRWHGCGENGDQCARLKVPLDHSGTVGGSVSLHVVRARVQRPRQRPDGVTLVIGGEPGESATSRFVGEYASEVVETLRDALPRNRVVVIDQRGTGGSGALTCRDLQAATPTDASREAEACAALLGARRGFYRTSDSLADVEALRAELAVEQLTIVGIGYGAYVAQRYALSHPDRVEALVLDLPVDAAGADPLMRDSLAAARRVLPLTCRRGCGFTRDPLADTARLSARMAAGPLRGHVVGADGKRARATLTPQELLFTMGSGDTNFFTRADYPAAVVSALRDDTAPLFRLKRRAVRASKGNPPGEFSAATHAAVLCEEVRFPWAWQATPAERAAATDSAPALLTTELARPFGVAAAIHSDLMRLCRRWPTASAAPPAEPGPMPDVPVLVLAGDTLIRSPLETARRTAERFARSHLVVAPVLYGTPLTAESTCVSRAVKRFLTGRSVPGRCGGRGPLISPGRPLPTSVDQLRPVRGVPGRRARVLRAVELTFSDWIDEIYSAAVSAGGDTEEFEALRGTGLRGGRYSLGEHHQVVDRFEFIPGVRLSIDALSDDKVVSMDVDGPGRLDGRLTVHNTNDDDDLFYIVRGDIGGRHVQARLRFRSRLLDSLRLGI